jgi:superfamily II DNA helicase RecQ
VEDKLSNRTNIKKNPESSIIYVETEKSCTLSTQLNWDLNNLLPWWVKPKRKDKTCSLDAKGTVIVATNAFGMGLTKQM